MLRAYVDLSCQDDEPDAGARQLLGGKPGPKVPQSRAGGGTSPLHLASCRGHVGVVHELLLAGADASRGDQFGFSALHLAARHGFPDVIRELLSFGTLSVNLLDEAGETALHTAARYAKTVCARRLLEFGGDPNLLSKAGRRAIDVIGQGQEDNKHSRLSLHSSAAAGAGRKTSTTTTNNNIMPPPPLPRDRSVEDRLRRVLVSATSGWKGAWRWPSDAASCAGGADAESSPPQQADVPFGAFPAGDGEGADADDVIYSSKPCRVIALDPTVVVDADTARSSAAEEQAGSAMEGGGKEAVSVHGGGVNRQGPLLWGLRVRALVKGRTGDPKIAAAINRYGIKRRCVFVCLLIHGV